MRVVKEIPHSALKITVYQWNNRYLIKFEAGLLEQTYKIQEFDISSEEQLMQIVSNDFINAVITTFESMGHQFQQAVIRSESMD